MAKEEVTPQEIIRVMLDSNLQNAARAAIGVGRAEFTARVPSLYRVAASDLSLAVRVLRFQEKETFDRLHTEASSLSPIREVDWD